MSCTLSSSTTLRSTPRSYQRPRSSVASRRGSSNDRQHLTARSSALLTLTHFGDHRLELYRINDEYADLYQGLNQDSRDLNEPPSNILGAPGSVLCLQCRQRLLRRALNRGVMPGVGLEPTRDLLPEVLESESGPDGRVVPESGSASGSLLPLGLSPSQSYTAVCRGYPEYGTFGTPLAHQLGPPTRCCKRLWAASPEAKRRNENSVDGSPPPSVAAGLRTRLPQVGDVLDAILELARTEAGMLRVGRR